MILDLPLDDIAYAAGLFDGEGCIHIGKYYEKHGEPRYHLMVAVSMTVTEPLQLMLKMFGGTFRPVNRSHKQQWQWSVYSKEAVPFLETVFPHLRVKYVEAAMGLLFQATFNNTYRVGGNGGCVRLPERILTLRKLLWEECRDEKRFNK